MTKPKCSLFVNDQENIMADILAEAALVDSTQLSQGVDEMKEKFYAYIETTPYASLVAEISQAMKDLGYQITRID